jgi:hypothetical protein
LWTNALISGETPSDLSDHPYWQKWMRAYHSPDKFREFVCNIGQTVVEQSDIPEILPWLIADFFHCRLLRDRSLQDLLRNFLCNLARFYPGVARFFPDERVDFSAEFMESLNMEMDRWLYLVMLKAKFDCSELPPKWYHDDGIFAKWRSVENELLGSCELIFCLREWFVTGRDLPRDFH